MRLTAPMRSAVASVAAAVILVVVKLVVGLVSGSLALIAEAVHSATDLVAALLTLLALRVAGRPADAGHPFGHGKAEHLAALAEGTFLLGASALIAYRSIDRLGSGVTHAVHASLYVFAVLGFVLTVDAGRAASAWRTARRYHSPALASNALHFATDMVGTVAVVIGLAFVRGGHGAGDSIAALVVAVLVVVAAVRLMRHNVEVLMDQAPRPAEEAARDAIAAIDPPVVVQRLRIRQAAGQHFADVVVGVAPDAGVAQGHAVADAVEAAVQRALPGSDVVVHVEPRASTSLSERVAAAALTVRGVREIHNLHLLEVDGETELSLHLKLPPDLSLEQAHAVASQTEAAIAASVPEVATVHTHIEPLSAPAAGAALAQQERARQEAEVRLIARELTGAEPLDVRLRQTHAGLVLLVTLAIESDRTLAQAHSRASAVEARIRRQLPGIAEVVIHTEPGPVSGA